MGKETAIDWLLSQLQENEMVGTFCTEDKYQERLGLYQKIVNEAKEMEKEQNQRLIDWTLNAYGFINNSEITEKNG